MTLASFDFYHGSGMVGKDDEYSMGKSARGILFKGEGQVFFA